MHQEHAIPWNAIASHFVFVRDNPHRTPRKTNIFPREPPRPTRKSDLDHFVRVLVDTVHTFARTERAKHPSPDVLASTLSPTSKLFDDALLERYPTYLDARMQSPTYWVHRADHDPFRLEYIYSTRHGDLADALKILVYATDLRAVLSLAHLRYPSPGNAPPAQARSSNSMDMDNVAQADININVQAHPHPHPQNPVPSNTNPNNVDPDDSPRTPAVTHPLSSLAHLSWGHHFGVDRMAESALYAYLYLNLASALGMLADGRWLETDYARWLVRETTLGMDFDAQQVVHRAYWTGMGVSVGRGWAIEYDRGRVWTRDDHARTRDYCKELFRIMYAYETFMAECGVDLDAWWTRTALFALQNMTAVGTRYMGSGVWAFA